MTGNTRLKAWKLQTVAASGQVSHGFPVSQVLYNKVFEDAVSGDTCGTVCVWNTLTGALRFRCDLGKEQHGFRRPVLRD